MESLGGVCNWRVVGAGYSDVRVVVLTVVLQKRIGAAAESLHDICPHTVEVDELVWNGRRHAGTFKVTVRKEFSGIDAKFRPKLEDEGKTLKSLEAEYLKEDNSICT